MKAKAQQESLARWAIRDPGQWKVWREAQQQTQFKEAQIEATSYHQPQPDPEQLKLLCNLYVEQPKTTWQVSRFSEGGRANTPTGVRRAAKAAKGSTD